MRTERRLNRLGDVLRHRQPDLTVVMENIHDPHNVSAVMRSCDAAGVMEVQLIYPDGAFPGIGKKSSASAKKWVEHRQFKNVNECYKKLHEEGFAIYATHLEEKAKTLYEIDMTKKVAVVVGNEHAGVSSEAAKSADGILLIPMFGMIQSLNVSVATAVILFEAVRQRISAGLYDQSKFSGTELARLLKVWAMKQ
ncbi:MAG: RNA methyltransferase [Ignavibacteriae bacterium]|nr:MAG: RNA methyltransferase [Ignavibacteriota bacterium]